jgi:bifunctional non-homologous end joining protein LigD
VNRLRASPDPLERYRTKRNFDKTPEPSGADGALGSQGETLGFVIQKHAATRLHYDFRLELDGVMLSWAVPKGPSYDPKDKRMAVRVEDHPISYNTFEGTIPRGQYGAGTVIVWDRGTWQPVGDPRQGLAAGKLLFTLHGQKMAGLWELVRIGKPEERQVPWLLFKKHDAFERPRAEYDVVTALPDSVVAKPLRAASTATRGHHGAAGADSGASPPALSAAVKAELPLKLGPQLATLSTGLPVSSDWTFEIKFDGYRLLTRIEHGVPRLITRGGHDWTAKMPALARDLADLGVKSAWLDGEIVVLGADGMPDFNALQNAFDRGSATDVIVYFLFDVPFFEGYDLRSEPLRERRRLLKAFLDDKQTERVRFSADFDADPATILQSAANLGLEGVIAKRGDAPYVSARTESWLKLKCRQRQEFVVGGYTDRGNDTGAAEIGSLLLGVHEAPGRLVFVGGLGTGWNAKSASALKARLSKLEVPTSPFLDDAAVAKGRWSKRPAGSERWVKPQIVVEASFADWTPDGQVRHAKFEGVRADKPAAEVVRERPAAVAGAVPLRSAGSATKVSNPQRVIDSTTDLTKLDLVRYYESVAEWMVPHLKGRPCSLVRGPTGIGGELFFQKHADKLRIPEVRELDPTLWPDHDALLEVPTGPAIAGAAQMNVIEFHTWNAMVRNIDKPDRIVFDLDPGEGVSWKHVQEAAALMRSFLTDLGLEAWLKTSGGKGLHVVVPLAPRHDWATVKGFSQVLVQHLASVIPQRFVAKSGPSNRVGRIFVDYLRNSHGATTVAAYSARARPGLGVSMPVPWDMLESLKSGAHWTIATAREHLSFHAADPWAAYWKSRQSLTRAMKLLGYEPSA